MILKAVDVDYLLDFFPKIIFTFAHQFWPHFNSEFAPNTPQIEIFKNDLS